MGEQQRLFPFSALNDTNIVDDNLVKGFVITTFPPVGDVYLGTITVTVPNTLGPYELQITGSQLNDSGGPTGIASLRHLTITSIDNPPPTDIQLDNTSVDENAAGAVIGNVTVVDPGDSHTLTVSDNRFQVVGGQLKLVAGVSLDHESEPTVSINITARDSGGSDYIQTFAITVRDLNEPPSVSLQNAEASLPENTALQTKVADIVVTDDALGSRTLGLAGPDQVMFEIVGTVLYLKAGQNVDFETNPVLDVTVTVDDATIAPSPDDSAALSISVPDVNERPTDIGLDNLSVPEQTSGAVVGRVTVTDPDAGDSHTFMVSDARFEIVGGQLKLKDGQSLDSIAEPTVSLNITARDLGGLELTESFQITVRSLASGRVDVTLVASATHGDRSGDRGNRQSAGQPRVDG